MQLLHGTSKTNAAGIKKMKKIIPNAVSNWTSLGKVSCFSGGVYLTNNVYSAQHYGLRASVMSGDTHMSIVHVDVVEDNLLPDENLLASRNNDGLIYSDSMIIAVNDVKENKSMWKDSLNKYGLVIHDGPIHTVTKIKNIAIKNSHFYWLVEETGTIEEYDCKLDAFMAAQKLHNVDAKTHKLVRKSGVYGKKMKNGDRAKMIFRIVPI